MIAVLLFILATYGLTQILVYGEIFRDIRDLTKRLPDNWFGNKIRYGVNCPACQGFHVGWVLFLFGLNPFSQLIIVEQIAMFLCGCLSSGTSYVLCQLVGDEGVKINVSKH